jgi:hypothetical protein
VPSRRCGKSDRDVGPGVGGRGGLAGSWEVDTGNAGGLGGRGLPVFNPEEPEVEVESKRSVSSIGSLVEMRVVDLGVP